MPFSFLASGLGFGAVGCSGSSSCSHPPRAATISAGLVIHAVAPQLTGGHLASSPFWKQSKAPEKRLRHSSAALAVPLQQAETNPWVAGAVCAGQPWLSGGEEWAATGVRKQVNGSRGCCTIGFSLPVS